LIFSIFLIQSFKISPKSIYKGADLCAQRSPIDLSYI